MFAVLFQHEFWMCLAGIPVAMIFYRRLRSREPSRSRKRHLIFALLATFALILICGFIVEVFWPDLFATEF